MSENKFEITKDSVIGEILNDVPESSEVFEKYFAGGCFGCPSVNLETLEMAAKMHEIELDLLIAEIKKSAGQ